MVREYCDYLRVERGLRPASCAAYALDLEQFAEHVEGRDALLMTAVQSDVSAFMQRLRGNGVESRSIARKLSGIRGFYRWLLMDKKIGYDPTVNIETPASWKVLPKSLAESEVADMLERNGGSGPGGGRQPKSSRRRSGAAGPRDFGVAVCGWAARWGDLRVARGGPAPRSGSGTGEGQGR